MQRVHTAQAYAQMLKTFHGNLPTSESVDVLLGSGLEAGAYLVTEEGAPPMNDRDLRTTLRRRFRLPQIEGSTGICHHASTNRTICGAVHGHDGGNHATCCRIGGGVSKRHDDVRDALHTWLADIGRNPRKEQEIPHWHTEKDCARLDIVLSDPRLGEVCIDVSVVTTVTTGAGRGALRGIERRERMKHLRYPGRGLYPFVLDVRGKWGREAHALVQAMVGSLPKEKRADAVRSCRRAIAVALQTGVAYQIHSAGTPPALAADISYIAGPPQGIDHTEMQDDSDFENTQGADNPLGSQIGFPGNAAVAGGG
mgnify:CR=1 FL=1